MKNVNAWLIFTNNINLLALGLPLISNNYAMAEDAVHNAFVSVIKHKEKYLQLSFKDFRSSIIIIVKNKCLDLLKAEKNFTDFSIDEIEYQLESDDSPIDIQIITQLEFENLRMNMMKLDDISKQILEMKYIIGMSYKQIGEALNITPKHVDTKIMRAKVKMRKLLSKEMN